MKDIYDFVVFYQNKLQEMKEIGLNSSEENAFTYGVLTGFTLGQAWFNTGKGYDEDVQTVLTDSSLYLTEVIRKVNGLAGADVFKEEMFDGERYRRTATYKHYAFGIGQAFKYVFDLYEAYFSPVAGAGATETKMYKQLGSVTNTIKV